MSEFPCELIPGRPMRAAFLAAVVFVLAGCRGANANEVGARAPGADGRQYGAAVKVGNGHVRMYVQVTNNVPTEIGLAVDPGALEGLPAPADKPMPGHVDMHPYVIPSPARNGTPYQFAELDWNPQGHVPEQVYGTPHFDVHFYTIPLTLRNEIDPSRSDFAARASRLPAPDLLPPGFVNTSVFMKDTPVQETIPRMGLHWLNPASPELPPSLKPFTSTFITGSFDGRVVFDEPMVTRAYLLSKPDTLVALTPPGKHEKPGYYPSAYRITWDAQAKEYRVALAKLAWKD